jgi:hypothetical protein
VRNYIAIRCIALNCDSGNRQEVEAKEVLQDVARTSLGVGADRMI